MNKLLKIVIAILGGIETTFSIVTPILLSLLWISFSGLNGFSSSVLLTIGILSALFRAIKIGFMK